MRDLYGRVLEQCDLFKRGLRGETPPLHQDVVDGIFEEILRDLKALEDFESPIKNVECREITRQGTLTKRIEGFVDEYILRLERCIEKGKEEKVKAEVTEMLITHCRNLSI